MTRLRGRPGVRIVGMTYYLPALADWLDGAPGQAIARVSERLAAGYNGVLEQVYTESGARVADVSGAFDTANFGDRVTAPGIGQVPRNVALVCQLDLGVRGTAARAGPARERGGVRGHRPHFPAGRWSQLSSPVSGLVLGATAVTTWRCRYGPDVAVPTLATYTSQPEGRTQSRPIGRRLRRADGLACSLPRVSFLRSDTYKVPGRRGSRPRPPRTSLPLLNETPSAESKVQVRATMTGHWPVIRQRHGTRLRGFPP